MLGLLDHGVESAGNDIVWWAIAVSLVGIGLAVATYLWWRRRERDRSS